MMKDILEEIVAHKRQEVQATLQKKRSMKVALRSSESGIIAEFKRKSPSKGWIHADARPEEVVPVYAAHGASALSILTDEHYFGGCTAYVQAMRQQVETPILRKDFIVHPYQVYEAKVIGADAILLIAADLTPAEYRELLNLAHSLGLEVLLEVHDPQELDYLQHGIPDMLGVNNRHLGTFHTDVQVSFSIAQLMQEKVEDLRKQGVQEEDLPVLVSESGINSPDTVKALRQVGFRGFLIGECFMKENNPGLALQSFIATLTRK